MTESMQSFLRGSLAVGLVFFSGACTTATTVTDIWRDPSYTAGPMRSLVVFGGRMNDTNRRTLEDGFVAALATHGVRAMASYTLFPELPDKDVARQTTQRLGVDGYLVAALRGQTEQTTFVPSTYAGGAFWEGFYGPGWGGIWDPGYVVTNEFVKFETSLWDAHGGGKLVWSAVTETENPSSGRDFTTSLTKRIIPALGQAGLLGPAGLGNAVSYAKTSVTVQ